MRDPRQWLDPLKFYRPTSVFCFWALTICTSCRLQVNSLSRAAGTSFWLLLYFGRWICMKTCLQPHTGLKHGGGVPLIGIPNPGRWGKKGPGKGADTVRVKSTIHNIIRVGKILCVLSATFFNRHILCFGNKPLLLLSTLKKRWGFCWAFRRPTLHFPANWEEWCVKGQLVAARTVTVFWYALLCSDCSVPHVIKQAFKQLTPTLQTHTDVLPRLNYNFL